MAKNAIQRSYTVHVLRLMGQDELAELLEQFASDCGRHGFQVEPRLTVKSNEIQLGLRVIGSIVDQYQRGELPGTADVDRIDASGFTLAMPDDEEEEEDTAERAETEAEEYASAIR